MKKDNTKKRFEWVPEILRHPAASFRNLTNDNPLTYSSDAQDRLRYFTYTLLVLLMLPVALGYGLNAVSQSQYLLSGCILMMCCSLTFSWLILSRWNNRRIIYRFNAVIFSLLLLYLVQIGGTGGSKILWMYTYPLVVFSLFGKVEGFCWSLTVFVAAVILLLKPVAWLPNFHYDPEFKIRFASTYLIVHIITWWIEYLRNFYRMDRRMLERRVDERTRELTTVNLHWIQPTIDKKPPTNPSREENAQAELLSKGLPEFEVTEALERVGCNFECQAIAQAL